MSAPVTVLVTATGAAPALAFVRGLRVQQELPVRVVGIDVVPHSFGLFECDRRYTVPPVGDADFMPAVEAICRHEGVRVIAPILDFEIDAFALAAPRLRAELGVVVISNTPTTVALTRDKRAAAEVVAHAGVAVPTCYHAVGDVRYPLVVKPIVGAGSHGVTVVMEAAALPGALIAAGGRPLMQQYVPGDEYTVDLVIAPDGEVLAAAPRVRVEVRGGQSYKGRTVDDDAVARAAACSARALGMDGQGNVQVIKSTEDDRPYFIEANPKFAAAMGLTISAGLNIPALYLKLALGVPITPNELMRRADVWMLRAWQERCIDAAELDRVPSWTHARS